MGRSIDDEHVREIAHGLHLDWPLSSCESAWPAVRPWWSFHKRYRSQQSRKRLLVLLTALSKWNRKVGMDPMFTPFCAALLAVFKTQRAAFRAVVTVCKKLELDDYFSASGAAVQRDTERLWQSLMKLWPEVPLAFWDFGEVQTFHLLAGAWLRSVLTACVNTERQPFVESLKLLHQLFTHGSPCVGSDAREKLRCITTCKFARHRESIVAARSKVEFLRVVTRMTFHLEVDEQLLELIDTQLRHGPFILHTSMGKLADPSFNEQLLFPRTSKSSRTFQKWFSRGYRSKHIPVLTYVGVKRSPSLTHTRDTKTTPLVCCDSSVHFA